MLNNKQHRQSPLLFTTMSNGALVRYMYKTFHFALGYLPHVNLTSEV